MTGNPTKWCAQIIIPPASSPGTPFRVRAKLQLVQTSRTPVLSVGRGKTSRATFVLEKRRRYNRARYAWGGGVGINEHQPNINQTITMRINKSRFINQTTRHPNNTTRRIIIWTSLKNYALWEDGFSRDERHSVRSLFYWYIQLTEYQQRAQNHPTPTCRRQKVATSSSTTHQRGDEQAKNDK